MSVGAPGKRVLIYSHDSFGLGHLRRCRRIANYLVGQWLDLSVLIISGSPIIGSYEYRSRVDFVRVPGVTKLRTGEYAALNLHLDIDQTLDLREAIMRRTAEVFEPDLFIVDKEPLGLRGEVRGTLEYLKSRGTPCVLGLRDIMDDPAVLAREWARKESVPALENLYDQIWIYGLREIFDPLEHVGVPESVRDKSVFTGYLPATLEESQGTSIALPYSGIPYLLVTPGGGGDGDTMVDWIISAYETGVEIPYPALIVFGPFMSPDVKARFQQRIDRLPLVSAIDFHNRMSELMREASAIVAMGGYNTFCEVLSHDKPALIVPRTEPRMEQFLRATAAQTLGLAQMVDARENTDPLAMARMLCSVDAWGRPSRSNIPGLLDGLHKIGELTAQVFERSTEQTKPNITVAKLA